jgi:SAM-dependent methyltransferase
MSSDLNVQFGCGFRVGPSWLNYDVSPTLRLSKVPGLKSLLRLPDWPALAQHGDVVKGLPLADASCQRLYCDQVLEHLAKDDVFTALRECRRLLAPGGVFRLFVPDLKAIATSYLAMQNEGAADWFFATSGLGFERRPRTVMQRVREWLGNSRHLWLWDDLSMGKALRECGFDSPRVVRYRDSGDAIFDELEQGVTWELALGMEVRG